jgi:WD40-like Beta Propeller Repeat
VLHLCGTSPSFDGTELYSCPIARFRRSGYPGDPGSFSPDGSKIVFMSSRDGKLEVYVMNADGTEVTQLTFTAAPGVSAEAAVR